MTAIDPNTTAATPSVGFTIHIGEGVGDRLREAARRLDAQRAALDEATSYEDLRERQARLITHQQSLLRCLLTRLLSEGRDGDMRLYRELFSDTALGFQYASGYTGGLIFHEGAQGDDTWAIHT